MPDVVDANLYRNELRIKGETSDFQRRCKIRDPIARDPLVEHLGSEGGN